MVLHKSAAFRLHMQACTIREREREGVGVGMEQSGVGRFRGASRTCPLQYNSNVWGSLIQYNSNVWGSLPGWRSLQMLSGTHCCFELTLDIQCCSSGNSKGLREHNKKKLKDNKIARSQTASVCAASVCALSPTPHELALAAACTVL
jgi:hypothetical protein